MVRPSKEQVAAGFRAGRAQLNAYSEFDSSMVPDDALESFVEAVLTAGLNVKPAAQG